MAIKGIHLFLIMVAFIALGGCLILFVYRYKFTVANKLAKDLSFTAYLGEKNIPAEVTQLGSGVLEFRWFEWVLAGEVQGEKVYIAQYFLNRPTLNMYRFVVFSPFETRKVGLQKQEGEVLVTESGVFFYHATPWTVNKKNVLPVIEQVIQVRKSLE